ncbi:MAG: hypothetical protein ABI330_15430 [Caldimonas sp.]
MPEGGYAQDDRDAGQATLAEFDVDATSERLTLGTDPADGRDLFREARAEIHHLQTRSCHFQFRRSRVANLIVRWPVRATTPNSRLWPGCEFAA